MRECVSRSNNVKLWGLLNSRSSLFSFQCHVGTTERGTTTWCVELAIGKLTLANYGNVTMMCCEAVVFTCNYLVTANSR